jgi:hypothetical protein
MEDGSDMRRIPPFPQDLADYPSIASVNHDEFQTSRWEDAGCALGKLCDESVRSMRGWQPVQSGRLSRDIVKGLAEFFVSSRRRSLSVSRMAEGARRSRASGIPCRRWATFALLDCAITGARRTARDPSTPAASAQDDERDRHDRQFPPDLAAYRASRASIHDGKSETS